jgi:hypothetical protein
MCFDLFLPNLLNLYENNMSFKYYMVSVVSIVSLNRSLINRSSPTSYRFPRLFTSTLKMGAENLCESLICI